MAFKMNGFSAFTKTKEMNYKPQTQMTSDELAKEKNIKDPQTIKKDKGLYSDMSGPEMQDYIKKVEALGDKATKEQKEKANSYKYYMDGDEG